MSGITHLSVGVATVSPVIHMHPKLIIFLPFVILGALLPDVDADYSLIQSFKFISFYFTMSVLIVLVTHNNLIIASLIIMFVILLILKVCTEHRTAAHSLLFLLIFTACIVPISKLAALYFAIGYFTHLFLDMLTWEGVELFYPCKNMVKISSTKLEGYFFIFSVFFIFIQFM